jgi:hypothetical protein
MRFICSGAAPLGCECADSSAPLSTSSFALDARRAGAKSRAIPIASMTMLGSRLGPPPAAVISPARSQAPTSQAHAPAHAGSLQFLPYGVKQGRTVAAALPQVLLT